jgi:hypothetical protein
MILPGITYRFTKVELYLQQRNHLRIISKLSNTSSAENYNDAATYNANQRKYVFRICIVILSQVPKIKRRINFY